MENKINLLEILKDCPKGTKLYSPLCGECTFENVNDISRGIIILTSNYITLSFHSDGRYIQLDNAECLLFPSKEQRDWSKFQKPFKNGDILISGLGDCDNPFIFKEINGFGNAKCYCAISCFRKELIFDSDNWTPIKGCRLATEEEKQKLFDIINENGYKWNSETKTLEKLVEPKFKVGDRIKKNKDYISGIITNICDDGMYKVEYQEGGVSYINIKAQDDWELVEPKFKAGDKIRGKYTDNIFTISCTTPTGYKLTNGESFTFFDEDCYELAPDKFDISTLNSFDKVLVRNDDSCIWKCNWYSHYSKYSYLYHYVCTDTGYKQCIPYKGNEHLRGTDNDCDNYYKNW